MECFAFKVMNHSQCNINTQGYNTLSILMLMCEILNIVAAPMVNACGFKMESNLEGYCVLDPKNTKGIPYIIYVIFIIMHAQFEYSSIRYKSID